MGWSCRRDAGLRLDAISAACIAQTGSSNIFKVGNDTYFWETGKEQRDGAITGSVNKFIGEDKCRRSGGFRIEGDGTMKRGPKWMQNVPAIMVQYRISGQTGFIGTLYQGETPLTEELFTKWCESWNSDGMTTIRIGDMDIPASIGEAVATDLHTGNELLRYKQPMFRVVA
jgi:hypothetical protein